MHAKVKNEPGPETKKYDILFSTLYMKPPAHILVMSDSRCNVTRRAWERHHCSCRVCLVKTVWRVVAQWLAHLALVLEVKGLILATGVKNLLFAHASFMSFAWMILKKRAILWTGTLTGVPLCRESHSDSLCRLKIPRYLCCLQNLSIQDTPAQNTQYWG